MPDIPITVASGDYDRVRALREGTVPIAGCAVSYSTVEANALFIRNLKNQEFDVSEMSFSTYITLKDRCRCFCRAPSAIRRSSCAATGSPRRPT
jgi:4,5-dihydroxyphthalate decarboxylase